MLKPYLTTYKFYYNGELKKNYYSTKLIEEPYNEKISGTDFEGLWDLVYKYAFTIPISMRESREGHKFLQFHDAVFARITPKNCKPYKLVITSEETTITMNELMKYDTEKVIQYLKERGMNACPILK